MHAEKKGEKKNREKEKKSRERGEDLQNRGEDRQRRKKTKITNNKERDRGEEVEKEIYLKKHIIFFPTLQLLSLCQFDPLSLKTRRFFLSLTLGQQLRPPTPTTSHLSVITSIPTTTPAAQSSSRGKVTEQQPVIAT